MIPKIQLINYNTVSDEKYPNIETSTYHTFKSFV